MAAADARPTRPAPVGFRPSPRQIAEMGSLQRSAIMTPGVFETGGGGLTHADFAAGGRFSQPGSHAFNTPQASDLATQAARDRVAGLSPNDALKLIRGGTPMATPAAGNPVDPRFLTAAKSSTPFGGTGTPAGGPVVNATAGGFGGPRLAGTGGNGGVAPTAVPFHGQPVNTTLGGTRPPGNTTFTASDNLRGTQINPGAPTINPGSFGGGGAPPAFQASGQSGEARDIALRRLKGLESAPDRLQLAQEAFDLFNQQRAPQNERALRDVGARAAAQGRLGAGMTTSELNDVYLSQSRDRDLLQRGLINDAGSRTMEDRLASQAAAQRASDSFYGQDLGAGALNNQAFGLGIQNRNSQANIGNLAFNQGLAGRDELRFERGYQGDLAQQALDNRYRELDQEERFGNNDFNRELDRLSTTGNIGLRPIPGAQDFAQGAANTRPQGGNTANLLQQIALRRATGRGAGQPELIGTSTGRGGLA